MVLTGDLEVIGGRGRFLGGNKHQLVLKGCGDRQACRADYKAEDQIRVTRTLQQ